MLDEDDDETESGIVLIRRTVAGSGDIGHIEAHRSTIYTALEHFVTEGKTTEILGYYPHTTHLSQRRDIYYNTKKAEEREYP